MAAYEQYKGSGVKWLGKIPSHWDIDKIRYFFDEITELNLNRQSSNQLQFKFGTIIPKADLSVDETVWQTISKYTVVRPDDIIINGLNLNYDLLSHRVGRVKENGVITSAYVHIRPHTDISAKYYEYLFKAMDARKVFHGFGTGVRATLSYKELRLKAIAVPPIEEQKAIVAYLDKATGEIDRAIEVQQQMIDALNERIQIIISNAVTKGLNPDAPLRDSGIDWLGQIPSHWETLPLKYLFSKMQSGKSLTSEQISETGEYPVYGGNGIRGFYSSFNTSGKFLIIGRQGALCGNVHLVSGKIWATDHAVVCLPTKETYLAFLYYLTTAMNLNQYATQSAQPGLAVGTIKAVKTVRPPLTEQQQIVRFIESNTIDLNKQIENCKRMIDLLTERKQIIINQVVTGKEKVI